MSTERFWNSSRSDLATNKGQSNEGCNHNSARYCSHPQGKHTSENVSEVMKMNHPYREVDYDIEEELCCSSHREMWNKGQSVSEKAIRSHTHLLIQRTYWKESAVMQVQNLGVPPVTV